MQVRKLSLVEGTGPGASLEDGPRLRVALATSDVKSVNSHFGSAKKLAVYEVSAGASRFVEAFDFDDTTGESGEHSSASGDKLQAKVSALAGCNLLFCLAIGASAAQKVVSARIHPVKLPAAEPIEQVIAKVQTLMVGDAPPWLRKVLAAKQQRSMNFLDEED
jgi:nitrogen fixation protein NifX